MSARTGVAGTINALDEVIAAHINSGPGGWIGYVAVIADQSGLTHSNDTLTGLTVTVTAGSSRYLKVTGRAKFQSAAAGDDAAMQINEDASVVQGGAIAMNRTTIAYTLIEQVVLAPSAGSHTYALTGGIAAGTGPVTMKASSIAAAYVLVEDIGPT